MTERQLATVRTIDEVIPIAGADSICAYRVGGWKVVDKIGAYRVGDKVIYLEIDSWVPHELAPFLSKGQEPREYCGVRGERLRSVKLRGVVSQGLLLPLRETLERYVVRRNGYVVEPSISLSDVKLDTVLNVLKWEPPIHASMVGEIRGLFPTHIVPKTDQERFQNIMNSVPDGVYEMTMKLDGTSCTMFRLNGESRVCSRNIELKPDGTPNVYTETLAKWSDHIPEGFAVQGEIYGAGIQSNSEKMPSREFAAFSVYDIAAQRAVLPLEASELLRQWGIPKVPELGFVSPPKTAEEAQRYATGSGLNTKYREGVVLKNLETGFSFKIISDAFLLREK